MKFISHPWFLGFLFLIGCGVGGYLLIEEPESARGPDVIIQGFRSSSTAPINPWVGRDVSDLIAELGSPNIILEAMPMGVDPPNEGDRAVLYIYTVKSAAVGGCVEVYVVHLGSGRVVRYYCR